MRARAIPAVVAVVAWLGGAGLLLAYVNWFSETGRRGGSLVLGSAWLCVLIGVVATAAVVVALGRAAARSARPHV